MNMMKLIHSRKEHGWTQQDLADKTGFSRNSIVNWETGKREPKFVDIKTLANVLEISPAELLNDAVQPLRTLKNEKTKKPDLYPSMSYWGEVIDNIHKVLEYGNAHEIAMIESLLKSGCELFSQKNARDMQTRSVGQHIDVRNNNMEADNINIGVLSTAKGTESEVFSAGS